MHKEIKQNYIDDIKSILKSARQSAYSAVNFIMVRAYWIAGLRIVTEEQKGQKRADYGKQVINNLAEELSKDFDKNFTPRRVREIRQFYLTFPYENFWTQSLLENDSTNWHSVNAKFQNTTQKYLFTKLTWTHIRHLLRVNNKDALEFYIKETAENSWTLRTLDRNIATQYYDRLLLSNSKKSVKDEMKLKTRNYQLKNNDFVKSPSILEFLNVESNNDYTEAELEIAIIRNLQNFLLELGKGFAFVARQKLIRTSNRDYYIDLVFYNYILKCFVLIDLKTERITHQDVGQMDMYVRMYDEQIKTKEDNPTIGIVLCSETDHDIAKYSILHGNEQIFASKYKLYLPSEEELRAEIEREKMIFKLQHEDDLSQE